MKAATAAVGREHGGQHRRQRDVLAGTDRVRGVAEHLGAARSGRRTAARPRGTRSRPRHDERQRDEHDADEPAGEDDPRRRDGGARLSDREERRSRTGWPPRAARPAARMDRLRPIGTPSSSSWPPLVAASITPIAMTARTGPEPGASVWPARTEMTAAIAPFGRGDRRDDADRADPERRGRRAAGPPTFAAPARAAHTNDSGGTGGTRPAAASRTSGDRAEQERADEHHARPRRAPSRRQAAGACRRSVEVAKNRAVSDPGDERQHAGRSVRGGQPPAVGAERPRDPLGDRRGSARGPDGRRSSRSARPRRGPRSSAAPQIPRPARKPDAPARPGEPDLLEERVGVDAGPEQHPGRARRRPRASARQASSGRRLGAVARQVEHGERQLEQVRAERLEPRDRVEHEPRIGVRVGRGGLGRPAVDDRLDDQRQADARGRPPPSWRRARPGGRPSGSSSDPVREQQLARVGPAAERVGRREVVEQRRRPTRRRSSRSPAPRAA